VPFVLAMIEGPELIIVLVVVLVLFGGAQLPKLARGLGEAQREFRRGLHDLGGGPDPKRFNEGPAQPSEPAPAPQAQAAPAPPTPVVPAPVGHLHAPVPQIKTAPAGSNHRTAATPAIAPAPSSQQAPPRPAPAAPSGAEEPDLPTL
jgi:sec-independent protein translocase protein TatA